MAIKYSIGARCANPSKESKIKKIYALPQHKKILSLAELAQHIQNHGSTYDRGTIEGVLKKVVDCMREQLLEGNGVQLDELGTFYLSLHSKGADRADDFTQRNISDVTVRWKPGKPFKSLMHDAKFEIAPWRKNQTKAAINKKDEA